MNPRMPAEAVGPRARARLECEDSLRAAALTVSRAKPGAIWASTVLGLLNVGELPEFQELLEEISRELHVDARMELWPGSFSVRFTRTQT